jgi:hypothetical protein
MSNNWKNGTDPYGAFWGWLDAGIAWAAVGFKGTVEHIDAGRFHNYAIREKGDIGGSQSINSDCFGANLYRFSGRVCFG